MFYWMHKSIWFTWKCMLQCYQRIFNASKRLEPLFQIWLRNYLFQKAIWTHPYTSLTRFNTFVSFHFYMQYIVWAYVSAWMYNPDWGLLRAFTFPGLTLNFMILLFQLNFSGWYCPFLALEYILTIFCSQVFFLALLAMGGRAWGARALFTGKIFKKYNR